MTDKDTILLENAYTKIYEDSSVLVQRRSPEEREKNHIIAINKKIQEYIKNGRKGTLYLYHTPITSLPDNLKWVGGDLSLSESKIQSLPEGLMVNGNLDLGESQIQSLPDVLGVSGYLDVQDTQIQSLPDGVEVHSGLYLQGSKIQSLPDGLVVNGSLGLSSTPIKSLPKGLVVKKDLFLRNTTIQSLPEGLKVGRKIMISGTPLSKTFNMQELDQMYPQLKGHFSA